MTPPAVLVAVDGAAGSGKSTLARGLAQELGVAYINTGLMYRALAAASIRSNTAADDAEGLVDLARALRFTVDGKNPPELDVEGYLHADLTTPEVELRVSLVASHPGVRTVMRDRQRTLGADGAVMEGRDIATVVLPQAPQPNQEFTLRFHYRGDVIHNAGNGVLFVGARESWYPHLGDSAEFSDYDLLLRWPHKLRLVATGSKVEEHEQGQREDGGRAPGAHGQRRFQAISSPRSGWHARRRRLVSARDERHRRRFHRL